MIPADNPHTQMKAGQGKNLKSKKTGHASLRLIEKKQVQLNNFSQIRSSPLLILNPVPANTHTHTLMHIHTLTCPGRHPQPGRGSPSAPVGHGASKPGTPISPLGPDLPRLPRRPCYSERLPQNFALIEKIYKFHGEKYNV